MFKAKNLIYFPANLNEKKKAIGLTDTCSKWTPFKTRITWWIDNIWRGWWRPVATLTPTGVVNNEARKCRHCRRCSGCGRRTPRCCRRRCCCTRGADHSNTSKRSLGIATLVRRSAVVAAQCTLVVVITIASFRIQSVASAATLQANARIAANGVITALRLQTLVIVNLTLINVCKNDDKITIGRSLE